MKKEKLFWRRLDQQAKVFALASNKKYNSIFRLSVILKEDINGELLSKALNLALQRYKAFKVKLKKDIFGYYLRENKKEPIIYNEDITSFKKINTTENNDYLFKITYFLNKINIDIFHALTDGNGGIKFLREIIVRYIELKYPETFKESKKEEIKVLLDSEDAYKKTYKQYERMHNEFSKGYMIQGEENLNGNIRINNFNINLEQAKIISKEKCCTLSVYMIGLIAYSVYETNYRKYDGKRPINIAVPINLNKYFETTTISNFFSYMIISLNFKKNKIYTLDDVIDMVKKQFEKKLTLEKIMGTMTNNITMLNNAFIKSIPLIIKKIAFRIGSLKIKRQFTMTISNIGKIEVEDKYKKYIDNIFVTLCPDWAEKIKCGICSFGDNLIVTFGTRLKDNFIENKFKEILNEKYKILQISN